MKDALAQKPHVVATITRVEDLNLLAESESVPADLLEYRLDNLESVPEETKSGINNAPAAALVTVRAPEEGGANSLSLEKRLTIYHHFMDSAAIVDTEISTLQQPEFSGFADTARQMSTLLLASFHDFNQWPGGGVLRGKAEQAFTLGADIAKVAVRLETMSQLMELVQLVESLRGEGRLISAMGMGPLGKLSRLVLARAGSCLNYGYFQVENAPGQWSAEELKGLLEKI